MSISNRKKATPKKAKKYSRVPVSRCVLYTRVSTEDQADSGLSLENQRARVRSYAEMNGWEIVGEFEDAGVSAKTLERPALEAAFKALSPGCVLVALKLDRLTRSVPDLYKLDALVMERGAEWATVTEKIDTSTATGRMMRTFIALIAEWERGIIAERTVAALGEKKRRGERLGTTPLGFRTVTGADGGKIVVSDGEEAQTVALARSMHAGGIGLREIARRLTTLGRRTKRGGKWDATAVRNLLKTRYLETINAAP